MFLQANHFDSDSDDDSQQGQHVRPAPLHVVNEPNVDDRPFTPSAASINTTFTSPAARLEKLKQQKLLQQQKMKQRSANTPMILQKEENTMRPMTPSAAQSPLRPKSSAGFASSLSSATSNSAVISSTIASASASSSSFSLSTPMAASAHSHFDAPVIPTAMDDGVRDLLREREQEKESKSLNQVEKELMVHGIQPVFDPTKQVSTGFKLDFSDMRSFLMNPTPKGAIVQCHIVRRVDGISNKLFPTYELFTKEDKFLLAARKRSKNTTSNYLISMDRDDLNKGSANFLGKVRSNFVGTEFVVYDKGVNPSEVDPAQASATIHTVRQEMAAVTYQSNILVSRGPRKMTVALPNVLGDGNRVVFRPMKEEDSILTKIKEEKWDGMTMLFNKPPKWNDQVGAYVLNFNGRVTMASVKNFQLISQEDPDYVILQFGKVGKDRFTMDYQWPMSPFQAFAICLSSFDYKLACE